eukprot:6782406-Alexandrium_andersonii.AAC.1
MCIRDRFVNEQVCALASALNSLHVSGPGRQGTVARLPDQPRTWRMEDALRAQQRDILLRLRSAALRAPLAPPPLTPG